MPASCRSCVGRFAALSDCILSMARVGAAHACFWKMLRSDWDFGNCVTSSRTYDRGSELGLGKWCIGRVRPIFHRHGHAEAITPPVRRGPEAHEIKDWRAISKVGHRIGPAGATVTHRRVLRRSMSVSPAVGADSSSGVWEALEGRRTGLSPFSVEIDTPIRLAFCICTRVRWRPGTLHGVSWRAFCAARFCRSQGTASNSLQKCVCQISRVWRASTVLRRRPQSRPTYASARGSGFRSRQPSS